MSRYHPLDVRHPANKDLLSRNFLLDPPAQDRGQQGQIRHAPAQQAVTVAPVQADAGTATSPQGAERAATASPWGERPHAKSKTQTPPRPQPARQRQHPLARSSQGKRNSSMLKWLLLAGVIYFFLNDTGRAILRDVPLLDSAVDAVEEILRSL